MPDYWKDSTKGAGMTPGNYADTLSFLRGRIDPGAASVLDIGCNRGWLAGHFTGYTGLDNNPAAIAEARAYWSRTRGWSPAEAEERFICWDAGSPWPSAKKFDLVICKDILEHLPDGHTFPGRIREILNPGGYMLLITPDAQSWVWNDPTHLRPYSRKAHRALAEAHGFQIVFESFESVIPGTQHIARLFGGRSPWPVRLLARIPRWPRNVVTLMQRI